jgi:hypothetical protein
MTQELAEVIASKILNELQGRSGFDSIIGNLDEDIKDEIILDISEILKDFTK